jgi:MarR family transcriptional regulator, 2-MHQ and catechol-resistance regulon repressor
MSRQPTHKEKTLRAFGAYLELLDTAEWFEREMRAPLASFDLTMAGFRLLELLNRVEIMTIPDIARRRGAVRQTIDAIVARLVERGWVRRMLIALPPVDPTGSHLAKSKRSERRVGVRVCVVKLTPAGKRLVRDMLPRHSKMVKALMRVLTAREQNSLGRICRKVREDGLVQFVREIRMQEPEESD